jgi:outer membrane protein
MKLFKCIVALSILSIFTFGCVLAGAEEIKIGYINLGKTLDEYEKTKESEKTLEKKLDKKEKERQKLVDEIKNLKDEIALLSDRGKQEKQPVIDEKIKNLQEFDNVLRNELRQERDEALKDILREIDNVIQDYGKERGYTAILNDRVLVYGEKTLDITQEITDLLNKSYKKKR